MRAGFPLNRKITTSDQMTPNLIHSREMAADPPSASRTFSFQDEGLSSTICQSIPEKPFRLWILTHDQQAGLMDFSRLIRTAPERSRITWDLWKTVHPAPGGHYVAWQHHLKYNLEELLQMEVSTSRYSMIQTQFFASPDEFYRPLKNVIPHYSLRPIEVPHLSSMYGISSNALNDIELQYPAPKYLLYKRLHDLVLALGHGHTMTEDQVRRLLHWQWHRRMDSSALLWSTPLAAIQGGDLYHVESTLYPHPPSKGWQ